MVRGVIGLKPSITQANQGKCRQKHNTATVRFRILLSTPIGVIGALGQQTIFQAMNLLMLRPRLVMHIIISNALRAAHICTGGI